MLKFAVIVLLVLLVVLVGIPLGMPMSGASMCPDCTPAGTWVAMCVALLASLLFLAQQRGSRAIMVHRRRAMLVSGEVLEPPPRLS